VLRGLGGAGTGFCARGHICLAGLFGGNVRAMRRLTARLVAACFVASARAWIFHYGGDCRIGDEERCECSDCDAMRRTQEFC
jgi:hypothetical protein